jgi:hypothetical protein
MNWEFNNMKVTFKKFLSTLVVSASVLTVNHLSAAQVPSSAKTTVESIANTKQELAKAAAISNEALKAKVKILLVSSRSESIAVALSELGISSSLALRSMVEAGVSVSDAVGLLVAANPQNSLAIVTAALKSHPKAEVSILQAAISSGADPDSLLPATAAGSDDGRSRREGRERLADSRRHDRDHGGGGVITPPKPVSEH